MRQHRTHLYLMVGGVVWPIVEPTTFLDAGVLHAVDFRDATKLTKRKTRDALCGKRIKPTPVTVVSGERVALPWPPPARNAPGKRCAECFTTATPKRPDWTWQAWASLLADHPEATS